MAKRRGFSGFKEQGSDVAALVGEYLKQETVGPLKDLGRFVAYGSIGSIFLAGGGILLLVALLRGLQTFSWCHGNLSWIPYVIVGTVAIVLMTFAVWRIASGPAKRRLPKPEAKR